MKEEMDNILRIVLIHCRQILFFFFKLKIPESEYSHTMRPLTVHHWATHLSISRSLRATLAEPMKSSVVRLRSYTCKHQHREREFMQRASWRPPWWCSGETWPHVELPWCTHGCGANRVSTSAAARIQQHHFPAVKWWTCSYLDVQVVVQVLHMQGEGLIPCGVEVLVSHFAFVDHLPVQFEFHVRVAGTWRRLIEHKTVQRGLFTEPACWIWWWRSDRPHCSW